MPLISKLCVRSANPFRNHALAAEFSNTPADLFNNPLSFGEISRFAPNCRSPLSKFTTAPEL